jgi:lipopolysaccharide core galacturonosyltransferase RgtB
MSVQSTRDNDTRRVFLLLAAYFLLQLLLRVLVSPNLELDEAEQLVLTQQLSWGYGSQPPLYTWLQAGLFSILGVNTFSLALLKNMLLFSTYACVYFAGRTLGFSKQAAITAMLSLFLLPQILWESQRDLTHSVLATSLSAATLAVWFYLRKKPSTVNYLLLGICWGLGIIAKYNYGIFLVSLLVASLTLVEYRKLLLKRQILYTIAAAFVIVAPHVIWIYSNLPLMLSSSSKFKIVANSSYVGAVLKGTGSLAMASISFAVLLLFIYGLIFYFDRKHYSFAPSNQLEPRETLLLRAILIFLVICVMMVLFFRVTHFKDRWMQQNLFFLPLALLPWMHGAFERNGGRIVRIIAVCFAIATLIGLGGRPRFAAYTGVTRFNLPYHEIATKLKNEIEAADLVVADKMLLGGTIRMAFPSTCVLVPKVPVCTTFKPDRELILWGGEKYVGAGQAPQSLLTYLQDRKNMTIVKTGTVQAQLVHLPEKTMTVNYVVIARH